MPRSMKCIMSSSGYLIAIKLRRSSCNKESQRKLISKLNKNRVSIQDGFILGNEHPSIASLKVSEDFSYSSFVRLNDKTRYEDILKWIQDLL